MVGVILGMPGPWAENNYEEADHYTTKIGGVPDWPFPVLNVKQHLLKCSECGGNFTLIAQVYAPVTTKALTLDERVIYVVGCLTPQCEKQIWRALRAQKVSSVKVANSTESSFSAPKNELKNNLWPCGTGEELDDESDDDIDLAELGRALAEATKLASGSKGKKSHPTPNNQKSPLKDQPPRSIDKNVPIIPCFYTYTQEEKLQRTNTSDSSKKLYSSIKELENSSKDDSDGEVYEEESYEYDRAISADRTYLKFKKRVDTYPEQCFRYSYGGMPLLASGEVGDSGSCSLCGGPRKYEMQIMPPVIYFLHEAADDQQRVALEKINWLTLLVYTCSKSCEQISDERNSTSGQWIVAEEAVVLQHE